MTAQTEIGTLAVRVGEISGQLREVIHSVNNMAQKVDGMTERLLAAPTAADFEKLSKRVDALEREKDRRDGATGFGLAILKSPVVGWLVGIAATALTAIKGTYIDDSRTH